MKTLRDHRPDAACSPPKDTDAGRDPTPPVPEMNRSRARRCPMGEGMDRSPPSDRLEELLAHRGWVRRVARALVADESRAEDLEQEVWLRSLARPAPRSPRAWLGTLLRNAASNMRRGERRRDGHESAAPPPRPLPGPGELLERAEIVERVARAVRGLAEPYRTTVLLRYFEDIETAEIAHRQGIPVETVRTRLKRAVALLRERLDGDGEGGRGAWMAALLPVAGDGTGFPPGTIPGGAAVVATEVLIMGVKAKTIAAAVLLVAAGVGVWAFSGKSDGAPSSGGTGTGGAAVARAIPGAGGDPGTPPAAPEAAPPSPAPAATRDLDVEVRDTSDRPVPGAEVALAAEPGAPADPVPASLHPGSLGKAATAGTSGPDGSCVLRDVPPGEWVLSVRAPGFSAHFEDVRFAERQALPPIRVILVPACALAGRVLIADGKPLPGVTVRAVRPWAGGDRGFNRVECRADDEGRYRLEGLGRGTHDLWVLLPSGVLRGGGCVLVPEVSTYDIRLAAGGSVRGRVLEDAGGAPVAGAQVVVEVRGNWSPDGWDGSRGAKAAAATSADGTFAFGDLPAGRLQTLAVLSEGFIDYPDPSFEASAQPTVLVPGGVVEREIRLRRGTVIRGRVLGPEGEPVAGAEVVFLSHAQTRFGITTDTGGNPLRLPRALSAPTGADGAYRISGARPGVGMLAVRARGLFLPGATEEAWSRVVEGPKPGSDAVIAVPLAGDVERDLRLVAGSSIEGTVSDGEGRPLPGVRVGIEDAASTFGTGAPRIPWTEAPVFLDARVPTGSPSPAPTGPSGVTDGAGAFLIVDVPPGRRLTVRATGETGNWGTPATIETRPGERVRGVALTLSRGGAIAGTVRRSDGEPLAAPRLRLVPGRRAWEPWTTGGEEINRQRAGALPVGEGGAFRVEGLAPGSYQIEAGAEGCGTLIGAEVEVRDGETRDDVEILLPPELTVEGRAVDGDGNAVPGAEVLVIPAEGTKYAEPTIVKGEDGSETRTYNRPEFRPLHFLGVEVGSTGVTDGVGRFRQGGLIEGKVRIAIRAPGFTDGILEAEAGTRDLTVVLPPALSIAGKVVESGTGTPVGGLYIVALPDPRPRAAGVSREATTASDGTFSLEPLSPGTFRLSVGRGWTDLDANCLYRTVPGIDAGTRDLVVEVDRGTTLSGRVVDEQGGPVTWGLHVWARREDPPDPGTGRYPDGSQRLLYDAAVLPDGRFRMVVLPGSFSYEVVAEAARSSAGPPPILRTRVGGVAPGAGEVVMTVRRGAAISGRVVLPRDPSIKFHMAGQLIVRFAGTADSPAPMDNGTRPPLRLLPDGDPVAFAFTTEMLEPGRSYDIVAANFYATTGGPPRNIGGMVRNVVAGSSDVVIELGMGDTITGTVTDDEGHPLAQVPVFAKALRWTTGEPVLYGEPGRGAAVYSGPDGAFTLTGLGRYVFGITTGGEGSPFARMEQEDEVAVGATGVRATARGGVSLSGTLLGADGKPTEYLYALVLGKDGKRTHASVTSKEDGTFTISGLAPGPVHLGATLRGRDYDLGTVTAPAEGLTLRLPE